MNLKKVLDYLEFKSCCCCISLKTGTKIFGFISMILTLFLLITSTIVVIENTHRVSDPRFIMFVLDITVQLIQATTSFCLLLGVYQAKRNLMTAWLVSTIIYSILEAIVLPSRIWRILLAGHIFFRIPLIYELGFLMIVEEVYGWVVVYSYYKTLSAPGNGPV